MKKPRDVTHQEIRFTFESGVVRNVGVFRKVLGEWSLVNDQIDFPTTNWVNKYDCPMGFGLKVLNEIYDRGGRYIIARDNLGRVWFTTFERMFEHGIPDNLNAEDQLFLPFEYWERLKWTELGLEVMANKGKLIEVVE